MVWRQARSLAEAQLLDSDATPLTMAWVALVNCKRGCGLLSGRCWRAAG